ncbi:hypothetical protein Tco_1315200 [Tanacetum coccineum]
MGSMYNAWAFPVHLLDYGNSRAFDYSDLVAASQRLAARIALSFTQQTNKLVFIFVSTKKHTRKKTRREDQIPPPVVEPFNLEEPIENPAPPLAPMDDTRTMAQLLQAPTEGYEDAIVIPEINANFELKHVLINLVQNKQFFGHDKDDPHAHIRYFNKITSTMRFPDVPSTSIKLMPFPFSLEDTFYNALNANDQDSLNSAAGGNFLDKMPRECLRIIESKSKVRNSRNKAVVAKVSSNSSTPGISPDVATLTTEVVQPPAYQAPTYQAPAPQIQGVSKEDFQAYVKANDATSRALIEVYEGRITPFGVGKEAITFKSGSQLETTRINYNHMTANRIDVIDMACEEYSQEVLGFLSGNPTPYYDPIVSTSSPTLTPFGDSDFLLFEEADSFLAIEDDPTSPEVDPTYYDPDGDILLLEAILNSDPSPPPNQGNYLPEIRKDLKICEANNEKSSVNEPPEVELKDLPPHLEYAFLEGLIASKDSRGINTIVSRWLHGLFSDSHRPGDQEKTTFTLPIWNVCYRRKPLEFDVIIRDKKGAENLAADHLSRLENPHQDKLENKEITETFPLETLGSVALRVDSTLWFADFANYHAGNFIVKGMSSQ